MRRCLRFSRDLGFGRLILVNLYALRATRPQALFRAEDPVGDECDAWLARACAAGDAVVACWGFNGRWDRVEQVLPLLGGRVHCLGTTAAGHPRHPLYLRADTALRAWAPPVGPTQPRRASTGSG